MAPGPRAWRGAVAGATLGATLGLVGAPLAAPVSAAADQPNIVVIYVDDFSPAADWLWADASRTPALARFVDEGIRFENASGVTSLCAPSRAAMLTGTYGHVNGVTRNDPNDLDPATTIAPRLQRAGYHTAFVGKYTNPFRPMTPKPRDVKPYALGWDDFDVLHTFNGKFYDYALWTREGESRYGTRPRDHSTQVLTRHAVRRIREAPADKPLFGVLALYNGHTPNLPMARFEDDPRCAEVEPWQGPAYNEADISDKPSAIEGLPLLEAESYDLGLRCAEMLTIDWAVHEVRQALRETGRLKDTVLVFASDNGWLMGDHRLEGKNRPYSHPVILYVLPPRGSDGGPRTVTERVSDVDLAPTFCDLAGCRLRGADGRSLLPLIDGSASRLARDFVYEEKLHITDRPAYYGLRTSERYSQESLWVYTEYSTGERELYDRALDPWQLQNLADDPAYAETVADLHRLLHEQVIEPRGVAFVEPGQNPTD